MLEIKSSQKTTNILLALCLNVKYSNGFQWVFNCSSLSFFAWGEKDQHKSGFPFGNLHVSEINCSGLLTLFIAFLVKKKWLGAGEFGSNRHSWVETMLMEIVFLPTAPIPIYGSPLFMISLINLKDIYNELMKVLYLLSLIINILPYLRKYCFSWALLLRYVSTESQESVNQSHQPKKRDWWSVCIRWDFNPRENRGQWNQQHNLKLSVLKRTAVPTRRDEWSRNVLVDSTAPAVQGDIWSKNLFVAH